MAIVFVSAQKKQKILFGWLAASSLLLLAGFSAWYVLLPILRNIRFDNSPTSVEVKTPQININFGAVDSEQVKNLEPFRAIEVAFTYTAKDSDNKAVSGRIMSVTLQEANQILEQMGMKEIVLEEIKNTGRTDPFAPY